MMRIWAPGGPERWFDGLPTVLHAWDFVWREGNYYTNKGWAGTPLNRWAFVESVS